MNSTHKWDIIGFGSVAVDDLLFIPSFPEPDSKTEVLNRERHGGGLAGTALVAASRLGATAAYLGVFGDDELSQFTLNEFKKENVDTSLCQHKENAKPLYSSIIIDQSSGKRTIFYSLEGFHPPDPSSISADIARSCKLVFFDSFIKGLIPHIVEIAHRSQTPVIADIESSEITQFPKALNAIDYLILNMELAGQITGKINPAEILSALDSHERICTVITLGKSGCWYKTKDEPVYHLPAYEVEEVDTTGCGDVFHGAFAAALVRGEPIPSAALQASAAAAMKATKPGGRSGIPSLHALINFINQKPEISPVLVG